MSYARTLGLGDFIMKCETLNKDLDLFINGADCRAYQISHMPYGIFPMEYPIWGPEDHL